MYDCEVDLGNGRKDMFLKMVIWGYLIRCDKLKFEENLYIREN